MLRRRSRNVSRAIAALLAISIAACKSGSTSNDAVAGVSVAGISEPLTPGATGHLTAAVTDQSGDVVSRAVTWTSDSTAVATVTQDGTVTGVAVGTAHISASVDGKSGSATIAVQNAPPALTGISPADAAAGSAAFTLAATGSGFASTSTIDWNGTAITTTFASATELRATIPASDLATAGAAQVTVVTPSPGGGTSTAQTFTITAAGNPVPAITSLSPSTAIAASGAFTLTVNGSNFVATSSVNWNGTPHPTTFVSATRLTAQIAATDIAAAGNINVTVINPAPGGGTSNVQTFTVSAPPTITTISAGLDHTCAISSTQHIFCWGDNLAGQLGDGAAETYATTAVASQSALTFTTVSSATDYSCAVASTEDGYCWGTVGSGQLGDGVTAETVTAPHLVSNGLHFTTIVTGDDHACGLVANGAAYCWGANGSGQLGNGGAGASSKPVAVSGGLQFNQISVGNGTTCGLVAGGAAYCWGANDGAIGDGGTTDRTVPAAVSGGNAFIAISTAGDVTCGVTTSHQGLCWGEASFGELGTGSQPSFLQEVTPSPIAGGLSLQSITVAYNGPVCAITTSEAAYCWGKGDEGELGNGAAEETGTPTAVLGGLVFTQLTANQTHACGVTTSAVAVCWGDKFYGDLGDGTRDFREAPVQVSPTTFGVIASSFHAHCSIAVTPQQTWCWGKNDVGQLGNGSTTEADLPTKISNDPLFASLGGNADGDDNCGVTTAGAAYCWGWSVDGELGNGTEGVGVQSATPAAVSGGYQFTMVSVGESGGCGIRVDGPTMCWGLGDLLGNGTPSSESSAVPVPASGPTFATVTVGDSHACGLVASGAAYCWGTNFDGEVGDGSETDRLTPVAVSGGLVFQSVSAGEVSTCGVTTSGDGYCWGGDNSLGANGPSNSDTPVAVAGDHKFTTIVAGSTACGLTTTGDVFCWGANDRGQAGSGAIASDPLQVPVQVTGGLKFTAITGNSTSFCGLTTTGVEYCWGYNGSGQLGIGEDDTQKTPVATTGLIFRVAVPRGGH